jgi:superfamily I DNA/RNA helicase/RecB family exonuclease
VSSPGTTIGDVTAPLTPDAGQARVLEHGAGSLLVTGGSGTGKTAALLERFAVLVETVDDPERVVLVVGSGRARDRARAWLLGRLASSLPGLQVLTIHGLANRILKDRFAALGYAEPPQVLSAAEQFARVRELLENQDPAQWPAYGHLLAMRGFADEVRQFLLRAQEALRRPEDLAGAAAERGLSGWDELARFLGEYQSVMDDLGVVDFAMLLQRAAAVAGEGPSLVDHLLVDDYQDSTFAAEAIVAGLAPPGSLVVAADPNAHVFSFQGTSRVPLDRFAQTFPGAETLVLTTNHRAPEPVATTAWVAAHTSEEHGALARELRRLHVDEGVAWSELAVVVRRQGHHVGSLLRALDDARVPRVVPERGLSLGSEPATFPYVLALRWLVADEPRREDLVEQLLTSDVVGLSPAAARGLLRTARLQKGSIGRALDVDEGLAPDEAATVATVREVLAKASLYAGMSVQDAFKVLWEELPTSARLVERAAADADARRDLDTVVTFANVVSEASEQGDRSVVAFLEGLDAGDHGPGYSPWERGDVDAVRVLTAHGAAGQEFDTVLVADVVEGNFPSLTRPEPMFDLAVLDGAISRNTRTRERLEDERRLFTMVLGRARRRVVLACDDSHPAAHGDGDALSSRSRFVDELGVTWDHAPAGPFDEPVSTREAAATWRRQLADPDLPAWRRLAALEGLSALGVDPSRWWFQRDWTDTGRALHETTRVSYSRLSNVEACELMHLLGDELGLGKPGGYHAWVGKTVHRVIEDVERGHIEKDPRAMVAALDERWRPQEFPSLAVSKAFHRLAREHMLRNWFETYGDKPATGIEEYFEFEHEGVTVLGYIDRIGPSVRGGSVITDFKTGKSDRAEDPHESLQLGIYYLAVKESETLARFQPVDQVELAFLRGNWKSTRADFRKLPIHEREEEGWERTMRERLSSLIQRKKELNASESFRPNPYANCRFCDFQTLCPLYPEGQPVFPVEVVRRGAPDRQPQEAPA